MEKRKAKLSTRLILSFLVIGFFSVLVCISALTASYSMHSQADQFGNRAIPSVSLLGKIRYDHLDLKMSIRTMCSPYISEEDWNRQISDIAAIVETYRRRIALYDKIARDAKEEEIYQNFLSELKLMEKANDEFVATGIRLKAEGLRPAEYTRTLTDMAISGDVRRLYSRMDDRLSELIGYADDAYGNKLVATYQGYSNAVTIVAFIETLVAAILAVFFGIYLSRTINKPLKDINGELSAASKSLESASMQVSSSSQELSSGSSELASSIEEMTSSLEELQSIIEANTKSIGEAEILVGQAAGGASEGGKLSAEMQDAMREIESNSKKIAKIIKVIDDIAFQTNILALNAAVEAARAGDAGKGFAVVAEQVKSLAQKSAEAAKETAELIEIATDSVQRGLQKSENVKGTADLAAEALKKVNVLVMEVNRASKEQLKGANQITQGVSQINSVVQGTAASSEENAAAGEELLSQAESLRGNVDKLDSLITGKSRAREKNALEYPARPGSALPGTRTPPAGLEITKPEEAIPLKDFREF